MNKGIKIVLLLIATFLFGFMGNLTTYFIMHPSPICAATKSILYGFGMPLIITLAVIFLLTLIGPKLFCGWVCPVGAVQEMIAMLSDKLGIKRCKTSFTAAQIVRLFIFLLFIFISATKILNIVVEGNVYALSLYDYINPDPKYSAYDSFFIGLSDTHSQIKPMLIKPSYPEVSSS